MTTQHSHNSYNSEMNGYLSGILKLNMNKNKLAATCREYKHLDDEWKFDVDNISVVEATQGNVFNDPNPKVYKHKSHSQPKEFNMEEARKQHQQDMYLAAMQNQFQPYGQPPLYGSNATLQQRLSELSSSSDNNEHNKHGADVISMSSEAGTQPIKLRSIDNVNCKFVPSSTFIAQVRKRSNNAKRR